MSSRTSEITRTTRETDIYVALDVDGSGSAKLDTGLPFFDHMLEQIARHSLIDLEIKAKGDLAVDAHHTVEDVGISLSHAASVAMGTLMCHWTRH